MSRDPTSGPLRENDRLHVCYRCGCAFLPMAKRDYDTGCPRCDEPVGDLGPSGAEVRCVWCGTTGYGKECPPCEVEHEGEPFPTEGGAP